VAYSAGVSGAGIDQVRNKIKSILKGDTRLYQIDRELTSLKADFAAKEAALERIQQEKVNIELEKTALLHEKRLLTDRIQNILSENQKLKRQIETLQRERPRLSPPALATSFQRSLASMEEKLEETGYRITTLKVDLKTAVTVENDEIHFQLPRVEDILSGETLSTVEFTFQAAPRPPPVLKEVPSLLGQPREQAVETLKAAGFKLGELEYQESESPPETVLSQLPSPGSLAEEGSPVDLTVSQPEKVEVPDLLGVTLESAREALEALGLTIESVTEQESTSPTGIVIGQDPPATSQVRKGGRVSLVVSKYTPTLAEATVTAPARTVVPDLRGLKRESAVNRLLRARLKPGKITSMASTQPTGTVLQQTPEPGSQIEVGGQVDLVVSDNRLETVSGTLDGRRLRMRGVRDISDLARASSEKIAESVGRKRAYELIIKARAVKLQTEVPELDENTAELLGKAGITSRKKLAAQDPRSLYHTLKRHDPHLTPGEVEGWIEIARRK